MWGACLVVTTVEPVETRHTGTRSRKGRDPEPKVGVFLFLVLTYEVTSSGEGRTCMKSTVEMTGSFCVDSQSETVGGNPHGRVSDRRETRDYVVGFVSVVRPPPKT